MAKAHLYDVGPTTSTELKGDLLKTQHDSQRVVVNSFFCLYIYISFGYLCLWASHCLLAIRYGLFDGCFCCQYHYVLYTMQELFYMSIFTLVPRWFRTILTKIMTWVYKDSLTLTYTINTTELKGDLHWLSRSKMRVNSICEKFVKVTLNFTIWNQCHQKI